MVFKGTIRGIDDVFDTDMYEGAVIIIAGPPGCMKSSLIFSVMSGCLSQTGKYGMYLTLEQDKESHMKNMRSVGIKPYERLYTYDYTSTRTMLKDSGKDCDGIAMVKHIIQTNKQRLGANFTMFALDSMSALYALARKKQEVRDQVYDFFHLLREQGLTSFIIMEVPRHAHFEGPEGTESFLADGVIEMGFMEMKNSVKPYLQVMKMRATRHSRDKFSVHVDKEGMMLTREVFQ